MSNSSITILIGYEVQGGAFCGVAGTCFAEDMETAPQAIGQLLVEPIEVHSAMETPSAVQWPCSVLVTSKVVAGSVQEAIGTIPAAQHHQVLVYIYREDQWFMGLANPGEPTTVYPYSINQPSIPASKALKASRASIEALRAAITTRGPAELLVDCVKMAAMFPWPKSDFERQAPVRNLCKWWNATVPVELRKAGFFHLYYWNEEEKTASPGDWEAGSLDATHFVAIARNCALFEDPDLLPSPVILVFHRGRPFQYRDDPLPNDPNTHCGSIVLHVDGSTAYSLLNSREDNRDMDEAYIAFRGLQTFAEEVGTKDDPKS